MAIKLFNSVAGFSVGEVPTSIILANGDIKTINFTRSVFCQVCDGKGGIGPVNACTKCMGSGQNKITMQQGFFFFEQILGPCQVCSGRGSVFTTPCGSCGSSGCKNKEESFTMKIPKGSLFKTTMINDLGNHIDKGQKPGALIVEINLIQEPGINIDREYNIYIDKHIDPIAALTGFETKLSHPDGSSLNPVSYTHLTLPTNREV